jgi:hypothetical protein
MRCSITQFDTEAVSKIVPFYIYFHFYEQLTRFPRTKIKTFRQLCLFRLIERQHFQIVKTLENQVVIATMSKNFEPGNYRIFFYESFFST